MFNRANDTSTPFTIFGVQVVDEVNIETSAAKWAGHTVSAGVVLLAIQLVFLIQYINQRRQGQEKLDVPGSPGQKYLQKGQGRTLAFQQWWRRSAWWAGNSLEIFGTHLGTKGQAVAATFWTAWLIFLCFAETGDDYLHLTKRFGIVGASQLPFHYLLIWKSSWSPVQTLTRVSHETLNAYHQILGRIVTLLVALHAAFYLNFYVQSNLLGIKLKEAYVLCGVVAFVSFVVIGTTALSPVRRWSYRVFYTVHVALATALIPVLFFHVSHIRIYLYETAAIYILNAAVRWMFATDRHGILRPLPNTSLIEVTIPIDSSNSSKRLADNVRPGQHAYISLAGNPLLRTFRSNPFTVASIPSTDGHIKFVARVLDGNTAKLMANSHRDSAEVKANLTVEGSYGLGTHEDQLLQYDRVLFVAGGVGATFIVPLYRQLLADLSPGKGSYRRQKVSFAWIARSKAEVTWAIPKDQQQKEGFLERLQLYITNVGNSAGDGVGSTADHDDQAANVDGIELEEQEQLLSDEVSTSNGAPTADSELPLRIGRPSLQRLVDQTLSHGGNERVAIVVCGPKGLSQNLRREITPWVRKGRDVWFHDESFSL
ncbi:hypothetical protein Q7P37_004088 [Cladosporium fusiforme]